MYSAISGAYSANTRSKSPRSSSSALKSRSAAALDREIVSAYERAADRRWRPPPGPTLGSDARERRSDPAIDEVSDASSSSPTLPRMVLDESSAILLR